MPTSYILAPYPRWDAITNLGVAASGGLLYTYENDGVTPRATYQEPSGTIPNTNPVQLDSDGAAVIYWEEDTGSPLYTIQLYDKDGKLILTAENYPAVTSGTGGAIVTVNRDRNNFFRNEQFTFWNGGTSFDNTELVAGEVPIADEWFFERSNTTSAVTISRQTFPQGTTDPQGPPIYYLQYTSDGAASDTENWIKQKFIGVNTFNNSEIQVTFWARTGVPGTNSTVTLYYQQFFGTGGAPDPTNTVAVQTFNINDTGSLYTATFTVDPTSGTSLGTNGDDFFAFMFQPQLAQPITTHFSNMLSLSQTVPSLFPYETVQEQEYRVLPFELKQINDGQGSDYIQYTQTETVRDALDRLESDAFSRNLLIGWYFPKNPRQLGLENRSTTFAPNNDNTYILDQTVLLSDGNDAADVVVGLEGACRLIRQNPVKFGIFQKVISIDSTPAIEAGVVSLRVAINQNSVNANTKIAVIEMSGTPDQQGTDIVSAWNGDDVPPTLAAGFSYLSDPSAATFGQITGDTAGVFTEVLFEDLAVSPTSVNLGVFIWSDTLLLGVNEYFEVKYAQFNIGDSAAPIEILSDTEVLAKCQQFIFKTYISSDTPDTLPGNSSPSQSASPQYIASIAGGAPYQGFAYSPTVYITHCFPVNMFSRSGTLTGQVYNPYTGCSGISESSRELL